MPYRVAFLGFTDFEREALGAYFRLTRQREPGYAHVVTLTDADLLVADADHAPSVQLVLATERQDEAVFIGARAPEGAAASLMRPIDALRVLRELDGIVARRAPAGTAATQVVAVPESEPALPALGPLTLRDPTPLPGEPGGPPLPGLFPGAEGLVGHEPPLPAAPGGWTDDLAALPLLQVPPIVPEHPEPLPTPPPSPLPTPSPAKKPPKATLLPGTPRALLVDDSAIARLLLENRLQRWQVQADHAVSSQAALTLLAQFPYDLVFLDARLGSDSELDGLALCRQIKQTPAWMSALVVLVTEHPSELDRVRGSLAGCDAYLGKPLDDGELQRLLQRQGLRPKADAGGVPG